MLYHTVLIVLHRPPLSLTILAPDFSICWNSVIAIIKLIRQYSRGNEYVYLPVTFIHTATVAASIILMKRHIVNSPHDEDAEKYLGVILEALEGCSASWDAAAQAKQNILIADEDARRKREGFSQGDVDRDVNDITYEMGQYFDLDNDSVMGGVGGVAGFLDPDYWGGGLWGGMTE
jgi:hypothetical protein